MHIRSIVAALLVFSLTGGAEGESDAPDVANCFRDVAYEGSLGNGTDRLLVLQEFGVSRAAEAAACAEAMGHDVVYAGCHNSEGGACPEAIFGSSDHAA